MLKQYIEYLKDNPQKYWFKAKWYGWGWEPATWQGWAITLGYLALVLAFASTIDDDSPKNEVVSMFILPVTFLTFSLLLIAYKKGEKPRWQWGTKRRKPKE